MIAEEKLEKIRDLLTEWVALMNSKFSALYRDQVVAFAYESKDAPDNGKLKFVGNLRTKGGFYIGVTTREHCSATTLSYKKATRYLDEGTLGASLQLFFETFEKAVQKKALELYLDEMGEKPWDREDPFFVDGDGILITKPEIKGNGKEKSAAKSKS